MEYLEEKKEHIKLAQGHGGDDYQHYDIHIFYFYFNLWFLYII